MIIKLPRGYHFTRTWGVKTWVKLDLSGLTQQAQDKLDNGVITFSVKVGKKRKLVKGVLDVQYEYSHRYDTVDFEYEFCPNRPEHVALIMGMAKP